MQTSNFPPALQSLATSNTAPTAEEETLAKDFLSSSEAELDAIESAIARLSAERDALRANREKARRILSQIRRVPPKILVRCMELACPLLSNGRRDYTPIRSFKSVCRAWYSVCRDTGQFWTHYTLDATKK
mgnify:CR=1 FL=1